MKLVMAIALSVSLFINIALVIVLIRYIAHSNLVESANDNLHQNMNDLEKQAQVSLDKQLLLEKELESLTKNRLPGLIKITYDKVLSIDKGYVKNIVFTKTGKSGSTIFEYKLVLENYGNTVRPDLEIALFDRTGVQVGVSRLNNEAENGLMKFLDRNEVRAHYYAIKLLENSEPEYFKVKIFNSKFSKQ